MSSDQLFTTPHSECFAGNRIWLNPPSKVAVPNFRTKNLMLRFRDLPTLLHQRPFNQELLFFFN